VKSMTSEYLLKWEVTTKSKSFQRSGSMKRLIIIFLIAGISMFFMYAVVLKDISNQILIVFFIYLVVLIGLVFFSRYLTKNKDTTVEYVITTEAVFRNPKYRSGLIGKFLGLNIAFINAYSKLFGMGTPFRRPFNTVSHYKVEGEKIILTSKNFREKTSPILHEFVIIPKNNINEILSILNKYIPKN